MFYEHSECFNLNGINDIRKIHDTPNNNIKIPIGEYLENFKILEMHLCERLAGFTRFTRPSGFLRFPTFSGVSGYLSNSIHSLRKYRIISKTETRISIAIRNYICKYINCIQLRPKPHARSLENKIAARFHGWPSKQSDVGSLDGQHLLISRQNRPPRTGHFSSQIIFSVFACAIFHGHGDFAVGNP